MTLIDSDIPEIIIIVHRSNHKSSLYLDRQRGPRGFRVGWGLGLRVLG